MSDKNIHLSIPMNANCEGGIEESPALLMSLDASTVLILIARIKKMRSLRRQDKDMLSLTRHAFGLPVFDRCRVSDSLGVDLWDECSVELDECPIELTEQQLKTIEADMNKGTTLEPELGASVRVDCCQEHYMDDGVYFTAKVKHTSIELESQELRLDTLQGYLARLEAK